MKVGTDAILLGSWATGPNPNRILDIGTGTGVIALMLAQRFPKAQVVAVEIDSLTCQQADDNFRNSPWADRLTVVNSAVQNLEPGQQFDLIVSNPPYFDGSLKPPDADRQTARHCDALSLEDLVKAADRLLSPRGRFAVILPVDRAEILRRLMLQSKMQCNRQCFVIPTPRKAPKRLLLEFARNAPETIEESELVVELHRHEYSIEFAALAKDFLLKL